MTARTLVAIACAVPALLGGCEGGVSSFKRDVARLTASAPERPDLTAQPLEQLMPPAPAPAFRVGDSFTYRFASGAEQTEVVTSTDADRTGWRLPATGATWTTRNSTMFNTEAWSGTARYGGGTQRFQGDLGRLFPLAVGKSVRYRADGRNHTAPGDASGGAPWSVEWTCSVVAQERVAIAAGSFDTFRVVCAREGQIRTYFHSPALGMYVLRVTAGREAGVKELVAFSPGAGRR
jgi:hypothetical protein